MKNNNLIPLALFSIIAVIYAFTIFEHISYWGHMDWDQFTFWNAVPRETILKYHQFPLWNPYANGGNVLLAHPHSLFLSPMYIFVLIFGPVIGLKIEVLVHLIVGLFGMFRLSMSRGLSGTSSFLSAIIFMLSSIYALHITEGHASWFPMAFVPWVFLYYFKSIDSRTIPLGAVIFLSLMSLAGSIDVFLITVVFLIVLSFFKLFQLKSFVPLSMLLMIFGGTFLLCSVKLIPMLEFVGEFPRSIERMGGTNLAALYDILLGRGDVSTHDIRFLRAEAAGLKFEWHEYGAYIGIIPLAMYVIGFIGAFKKHWPLTVAGLISLWIAMGDWSYLNMWAALHSLPVFDSFQVPSRFILGFVFSAALLSGCGLECIQRWILSKKRAESVFLCKVFVVATLSFVAFDLYQINSPAFTSTFSIPPVTRNEHAQFAQRYGSVKLKSTKNLRSSMYPIFLSNSGILDGYEVMNVKKGDVLIESDPGYRGEVYLLQSGGNVSMKSFSPNRIVVDFTVENGDLLVVNQNYHKGWKVKKGLKTVRAEAFNGLISTRIGPGHYEIEFYYMPVSFLIGLVVSISFILLGAVFTIRRSQKC
jgi:hypothetical protein